MPKRETFHVTFNFINDRDEIVYESHEYPLLSARCVGDHLSARRYYVDTSLRVKYVRIVVDITVGELQDMPED